MNRTLLALMLVLCSVTTAQVPEYVPAEGLVGWWSFDGDIEDDGPMALPSTSEGVGLEADRFGFSDMAAAFDGLDDQIRVLHSESLNLTEELTVVAWIKSVDIPFGGNSHCIAAKRDEANYPSSIGTECPWTFSVNYQSWIEDRKKLLFGYQSNNDWSFYQSQDTISTEVWAHVGMTVFQDSIVFYRNSEVIGFHSVPLTGRSTNGSDMLIGSVGREAGAEYFKGSMDDLGIWNRALSPTEIQTLFTLTPLGCTNEQACNYDASAIEDDGSCVYPPSLDLGEDIETCEDSVTLDAGEGFGSYLWSTGDTTRNIQVQESGIYGVEVFEGYENLRSVHLNAPTILESSQEDLIHDIFSGTHPFSISLWVKSDDYTNGQICDKGYIYSASESNASSMQVFVGGNGLSFQVYSDGDNWLSVTTDSDHVPEEGQWSHIVCCYDGGVDFSSMSIFINGELIDTSGDQVQEGNFDGLHSNTEPLHFGARVSAGGSYAYPLSGLLDDITVFDQALTATQVDDLYTCGSCLNPAYHWGFEDPQHVVGELISGHFQSTGQGTSTLYSPSFSGNDFVSSSNEVRSIHPNCVSSDSISVFLVPCGDLPSLCGEGTVWDPFNQECIVAIPTDTDFDGCVAAGDLLNLLGTFGSCPPIPFSGPCQGQDHVTYQDYDYDIVAIGEQCWFAENLQAESYRNGDEIESGISDADWSSLSGATSVYGEGTSDCESFAPDGDACIEDWPLVQYGRLYNWYAVDDERGLCPFGWHVPSLSHWTELTVHLDSLGDAGFLMKTSTGWSNNGGGSNDSGFSGLPTGYRNWDGSFLNAGKRGYWWSCTPHPSESDAWAYYLRLIESQNHVDHFHDEVELGFAIRCIKDQ